MRYASCLDCLRASLLRDFLVGKVIIAAPTALPALQTEHVRDVRPSAANSSHVRTVHANSKVSGRMLNDTARMLRRFYAPYNVQLEQLVGRKLW